jgi:hypothetical protein
MSSRPVTRSSIGLLLGQLPLKHFVRNKFNAPLASARDIGI